MRKEIRAEQNYHWQIHEFGSSLVNADIFTKLNWKLPRSHRQSSFKIDFQHLMSSRFMSKTICSKSKREFLKYIPNWEPQMYCNVKKIRMITRIRPYEMKWSEMKFRFDSNWEWNNVCKPKPKRWVKSRLNALFVAHIWQQSIILFTCIGLQLNLLPT